ncbi:MAG TPA: chromosomal replication initiator protein DnaA [Candidatus Paceibacterota bacterium]|nr:chromosomal replication initiator protein DnaA [Candidatus Paceibacterota bacterium]
MTAVTPEELWKAVLGEMEVSLSRANFTTWFKNTLIISRDQNTVTVSVPNQFVKEWLENKFNKQILQSMRKLVSDVREVKYVVGQPKVEPLKPDLSKIVLQNDIGDFGDNGQSADIDKVTHLNRKYVMDSFVVGSHNQFAFGAAQGVVKGLGKLHNPLFLYGGVGLGKTHLAQAIGNTILAEKPETRILYTPAERLTAAIVDGLLNQTIEGLKRLYTDLDLLIVDDVQYLAGKTRTQDIFFGIFNELFNRNKHVILTSDRPPKAIAALEERLQSRFEGGIIADIGAPDQETRIAILQRKSTDRNVQFPDEVIEYIAANIQKNVRELEGALNRVVAFAQIYNRVPDLREVKNIIQAYMSVPHRKTSPQAILKTVADFYSISLADLTKRSRKKEVVKPRQVAMFLLREEVSLSFPEIGQKLGGRDHSTVIHACDKIRKEEAADESLKQDLTMIRERVYNAFQG